MFDYWMTRYLETMAKAEAAHTTRVREAYLQLAGHYRAMHRICGRPANRDYMLAA